MTGERARDSHDLTGRTVVVMGAGAIGDGWGNGKASAVVYARRGASVVCVDCNAAAAEETASVIATEGGRALAMAADATSEVDVQRVVDDTVGVFGRLDVMHNNVGVGGSSGLPDEVGVAEWEREIAQNLTSAFLGIRCAVPVMRGQQSGVITNTSSTFAVRFSRGLLAGYTAGKAAVEALTRVCAVGYGASNIRVNCIRIGFSETPLMAAGLAARRPDPASHEAAMTKSRAKVPLRGEHGTGFDVAHVAAFLASDAAGYLSGITIPVDGALELAPI